MTEVEPMTEVDTPRRRWRPGPIIDAYAYAIVRLRWMVVGFWLVARSSASRC